MRADRPEQPAPGSSADGEAAGPPFTIRAENRAVLHALVLDFATKKIRSAEWVSWEGIDSERTKSNS